MTIETFGDTSAERDREETPLTGIILDAIHLGKFDVKYQMTINDTIIKGQTQLSIESEHRRLVNEGYVQIDDQYGPYLTDKGIEKLANQ